MRDDERDDETPGEEEQPTRQTEQPRAEDQPTKVGADSPAQAYEDDDVDHEGDDRPLSEEDQPTRVGAERPAWLEGEGEDEEDDQPTRIGTAVTNEPGRADEDDEYKWHTGLKRPTGAPDAIEFVDVHKAFG